MTPFDQLIPNLLSLSIDPWFFLKIFFLLGLLIYIAFAVIVVRQVKLMSQTLDGALDLSLKLITWAHLCLAIGVFVLAIIIL